MSVLLLRVVLVVTSPEEVVPLDGAGVVSFEVDSGPGVGTGVVTFDSGSAEDAVSDISSSFGCVNCDASGVSVANILALLSN